MSKYPFLIEGGEGFALANLRSQKIVFPSTNLKPDYLGRMNETFSKGYILKGNYNLLLTKIQT